ncbi:hypothetical protein [uncultured Methanobrevibacter sp.]|uniref:hypothetical protein n=1 Tax=uncultured Methanobrevibacter sp. TaxID=253161 RepID=UPI0026060C0F|nr:hypothetical protein [uncultured Methanobrevibacter sp.]
MADFNRLRKFTRLDEDKRQALGNLISDKADYDFEEDVLYSKGEEEHVLKQEIVKDMFIERKDVNEFHVICERFPLDDIVRDVHKQCPECGRKFSVDNIHCPDCLVKLKVITDYVDVKYIESKPEFEFIGSTDYESFDGLLCKENAESVSRFDFDSGDYDSLVRNIKRQSFKNLDILVQENDIELDDLEILDKVILYAKSFVEVDFKSYGGTLGYFEYNRIFVDDRQRKSLQITTLIHELTHFLIKEILTRALCIILDTTKNGYTESFVTYILSDSPLNRLVDEYAAHTVEGRFTIFGYQDYSSFVSLQGQVPEEHVEIAKTIGNTFANSVKDILESFLDWDLREEIKEQFLKDTIERPDYRQLAFESCNKLTDEGLLQAVQLILSEGFINPDLELLERYRNEFQIEY